MVQHKKRILGFGLAAAGFFIVALLVACVAMGGDRGMADDRIADLSGIEGGSGDAYAASSVSSSINYQGRLTDSAGNPLDDTYTMTFKLYENATGGTALATDTHSVTVTDGLFSTTLNLGTNSFDGRALWLGIKVESDPEMTPRQELQPVPYALSLRPGAVINGSVNNGPVLQVINKGLDSGDGVWAAVYSDESCGVYVKTFGDYSEGVRSYTYGNESAGVNILTSGEDSCGVYAVTFGVESPAVYGHSIKDVGVYGKGEEAGGYFTTTAGGTSWPFNPRPGVNVSTRYWWNPGVLINTSGYGSEGVYAYTSGDESPAVYGYSSKDVGVYGQGKEAGGYFTTTMAGKDPNLKPGVNVSTQYDSNPGVLINTSGHESSGVYITTSGCESHGVYAETSADDSYGVWAKTSGYNSCGVSAYTYGKYSEGIFAVTFGDESEGVVAYTTGYDSPAVYGWSEQDVGVYGKGKEAGGYFTTTEAGEGWPNFNYKPSVNVSTQYDYNPGVLINTSGNNSKGVFALTSGDSSEGVYTRTSGYGSQGIFVDTSGDFSEGVYAYTSGSGSAGIYGVSSKYYGGIFDGAGNMGIKVYGNVEKTGTVSFVEDHPKDPTKEIVYVCLEGGETGTYTRGSGQLIDGEAVVQLPEHFSLVTSSEGLTVQLTPTSDCKGLYVVSKLPTELVVKELNGGTSDATFDYLVNGVRKGYEDYQPIRDKQEMPESGVLVRAPEHLEADEHLLSPEHREHRD